MRQLFQDLFGGDDENKQRCTELVLTREMLPLAPSDAPPEVARHIAKVQEELLRRGSNLLEEGSVSGILSFLRAKPTDRKSMKALQEYYADCVAVFTSLERMVSSGVKTAAQLENAALIKRLERMKIADQIGELEYKALRRQLELKRLQEGRGFEDFGPKEEEEEKPKSKYEDFGPLDDLETGKD